MSQGVAVRNDISVSFATSWNNSGFLWKGNMMFLSAHPFRKLCKAGGLNLHVAFGGWQGVSIPLSATAA